MDDKKMRSLYETFSWLILFILLFGAMYHKAIEKSKELETVDLIMLLMESLTSAPFYILIAVELLLIVLFIDTWDKMVKKIRKNKLKNGQSR
ncbi:MAG: hypothetical protein ACO2ON_01615 [Candidatus Nanopusillus sp.]